MIAPGTLDDFSHSATRQQSLVTLLHQGTYETHVFFDRVGEGYSTELVNTSAT